MLKYESAPPHKHGQSETTGVLVVNLGTPDAPTTGAVRRYLAEFLADPRVVEIPRALWWCVLHGFILRTRPSRSAHAYKAIWAEAGSPLLVHSQAIADGIHNALDGSSHDNVQVELAMSYGKPAIRDALDKLHLGRARRIILLPLYPQYSGTTTGSVFDSVTRALARRRWVPEFDFINHYHDNPAYIAALATSVRDYWAKAGRGERLLMSFHGLPEVNLAKGDPYHCQCHKTARLLAAELGLAEHDWRLVFQSRLGRGKWLAPYTDEVISKLAESGVQTLDVVCPGFAADCLETLEEIAIRYAELFREHGGTQLRYIPALNANDAHIQMLATLIRNRILRLSDAAETDAQLDQSKQRALAMGAQR